MHSTKPSTTKSTLYLTIIGITSFIFFYYIIYYKNVTLSSFFGSDMEYTPLSFCFLNTFQLHYTSFFKICQEKIKKNFLKNFVGLKRFCSRKKLTFLEIGVIISCKMFDVKCLM